MQALTPFDYNGMWVGAYCYDDDDTKPVAIAVVLQKTDRRLVTGKVLEPNTFGDEQAPALVSDAVNGTIANGTLYIQFVYDGVAGPDHAVDNVLAFAADGTQLVGTWSIDQDWSGTITLTKIADLHRVSPTDE